MPWQQKENAIREKRTNLATKNNLMGPAGKLGIIALALGHPIMREGGGLYDVNCLDDPYADFTDTEFEKTASGQHGPLAWRDEILDGGEGVGEATKDNPNFEGYVFDGLSRGLHFEVQTFRHSQKIIAYYKGYLVYEEVAGELLAYAPFPEWEDIVNRLYRAAKGKHAEIKEIEYARLEEKVDRKKASFWERMRMRWGF